MDMMLMGFIKNDNNFVFDFVQVCDSFFRGLSLILHSASSPIPIQASLMTHLSQTFALFFRCFWSFLTSTLPSSLQLDLRVILIVQHHSITGPREGDAYERGNEDDGAC
jgi:hypothetical protein